MIPLKELMQVASQAALTREYNAVLADLVLLATRDVVDLWRLTPADARETVAMLVERAPAISATYGAIAATLGADLYSEIRAMAKAKGRYTVLPADPAPDGQVEALARWAAGPLFGAEPDDDLALGLFAGGMDRLIRQPFRQSVSRNAGADRAAKGMVRIAQPGACTFCTELADEIVRVDPTGASDGDHYHRSCKCVPAPAF